eukprot:TRINITY_DN8213_c0_g1_i1.p1 TRINITY_DN8213_c0_g1~~TRINITY_DN8213_c0_g1_i1.p1  ORF type:complete len:474 (+),score=87.30 TRINITY_DN8213_c0_g1_i1:1322-2743(+)
MHSSGHYRTKEEEESDGEYTHPNPQDSTFGVFVSDVARGTTDDEFRELFSQFGRVMESSVVRNRYTGETKGFGFVRYFDESSMRKLLAASRDELPAFVDKVTQRRTTVRVSQAAAKNILFIGNIPRGLTAGKAIELLESDGGEKVVSFEFGRDSKCWGWATYKDHESALNAMKTIQHPTPSTTPSDLSAYLVQPKVFDPSSIDSCKTLFVRGLVDTTEEGIRTLFGDKVERVVPLSSLVEKKYENSKGDQNRGHAVVHFYAHHDAAEVLERLHATEVNGCKLGVEWCLPKKEGKERERERERERDRDYRGVSAYPQPVIPFPLAIPRGYPYQIAQGIPGRAPFIDQYAVYNPPVYAPLPQRSEKGRGKGRDFEDRDSHTRRSHFPVHEVDPRRDQYEYEKHMPRVRYDTRDYEHGLLPSPGVPYPSYLYIYPPAPEKKRGRDKDRSPLRSRDPNHPPLRSRPSRSPPHRERRY